MGDVGYHCSLISHNILNRSSFSGQISLSFLKNMYFDVSNSTFGQILSFNGIASALASATFGKISKLYSSHVKQVLDFTLLLSSSIACLTRAPNVASVFLLLIPMSLSTSNLRICLLSLMLQSCLLYTSPSPRDATLSRMPSSA